MKFDLVRLGYLRVKCFHLIDREIALDGHHKSYEGALAIHLGSRFNPDDSWIELSCYVAPFGGRGHNFATLDEFEAF